MNKRFTSSERLTIIQSHIQEFGRFDASEFEVAARSTNHPAYEWFTRDEGEAARLYRVEQARKFARIRIVREVEEEISAEGETSSIIIRSGPALVSPPQTRGTPSRGYILTDSEEGRTVFKEEAKLMLLQWVSRFRDVLTEKQIKKALEISEQL